MGTEKGGFVTANEGPRLRIEGKPAGGGVSLAGRTISIGRHRTNDVVLDGVGVDRVHAELFSADGTHYVRDLNSTSGTFVNGERLSAGDERALSNGDRIVFGSDKAALVFEQAIERAPSSTPSPEPSTPPKPVAEAAGPATDESTALAVPGKRNEAADEAPGKEPAEREVQGDVRFRVRTQGKLVIMVTFVKWIREHPDIRLVRMVDHGADGTELILKIRRPLRIKQLVTGVDGVADIEVDTEASGGPTMPTYIVHLAQATPDPTKQQIIDQRRQARQLNHPRPD